MGKITLATCTTVIVGGAGLVADIQSILLDKPKNSVVIEQIKTTPIELSIPYQELSNSKLAQKYVDKEIELDATYLGPWNLEQVYGIKFPQNVLTLNHRDASYTSQSTPFGSSDLAIPEFALTIPTSISSEVLKIKSHSKIKIIGSVKSQINQFGKSVIVLEAKSVTPAG